VEILVLKYKGCGCFVVEILVLKYERGQIDIK
jgi:hypothetical protein